MSANDQNKRVEELLQQKLQGYEEATSESDWLAIQAELGKKRGIKVYAWWAGAAAAAVLLSLVLLRPTANNSTTPKNGGIARSNEQQKAAEPNDSIGKRYGQLLAASEAKNERATVTVEGSSALTAAPTSLLPDTARKQVVALALADTLVYKPDTLKGAATILALTDEAEPNADTAQLEEVANIRYQALLNDMELSDKKGYESKYTLAIAGQGGGGAMHYGESAFDNSPAFSADKAKAPNFMSPSPLAGTEYLEASIQEAKHRMPLLFGVSIEKKLTERVTLSSGLVYAFLSSTFTLSDVYAETVEQQLHYLGIPVSVRYYFTANRRFNFYVSGGAMVEKGLTAVYSSARIGNPFRSSTSINGLQWSLSIQPGASYSLSRLLSLYFEPSLAWYIPADSQPKSMRTERPVLFNFGAGVRFSL